MSSPTDDTASIARQREEPAVITLTGALTKQAVARLGTLFTSGPLTKTVIVDVSDISDFDSAGTSGLLALQQLAGPDRLVVVGVREAAARLLAIDDLLPTAGVGAGSRQQLMPGLMMVTPNPSASAKALEETLMVALDRRISIVVADLGGYPTVSTEVVDALASAGRAAEQQGQELVLVNVAATAASVLHDASLGATTHLARTQHPAPE